MTREGTMVWVWDSGLRAGSENLAIDRLWLRQHARGKRPDLLRFYRSLPCAMVGHHQAVDRELRLDYCRRHGIEVLRRPSGGGALYVDQGQLVFSLILKRPPVWQDAAIGAILAHCAQILAAGLARLGLKATFKAPNDLEVKGRKLASIFLGSEADSLLLQGFLLLDLDIRRMLEALRVPTEKLSPSGLESARDRLITLRQCLGRMPEAGEMQTHLLTAMQTAFNSHPWRSVKPVENAVTGDPADEAGHAFRIDWQAQRDEAAEAIWRTADSVLRIRLVLDEQAQRIKQAVFAGDLHCRPLDFLERLQDALTDLPLPLVGRCLAHVAQRSRAELAGFGIEDLRRVLQLAIDKFDMRRRMGLSASQANGVMCFGGEHPGTGAVLAQAQVMLVPYCAKPPWCKWRHQDGCTECGLCEVGEAYRLARERHMQVTSINNYEHLRATLATMKAAGVRAYVGMCCSNFFIKRHRAFREAGMPALLLDISGSNCYELQQEEQAYAGNFQAQAHLELSALRKLMRFIPPQGGSSLKKEI